MTLFMKFLTSLIITHPKIRKIKLLSPISRGNNFTRQSFCQCLKTKKLIKAILIFNYQFR